MSHSWYLVTWTTYGSWLPGDPRGFRTRKHKRHVPPPKRYSDGGDFYNPQDYREILECATRECKGCVTLNEKHRSFLRRKLVEIGRDKGFPLKAVHVGRTHVHVLLQSDGADVPRIVNLLKGITSRGLSEHGLPGRVWTRGYHMRVIPENALPGALRYLKSHKE